MAAGTVFDRKDFLALVDIECLQGGSSTVIVAPQKLGKTHLLEHIYERGPQTQDTLLCRATIELLQDELAPGEALSDATFFLYFMRELGGRIAERVAAEQTNEAQWSAQIAAAEERLAQLDAGGAAAVAETAALRDTVEALRQRLAPLARLRELSDEIAALLSHRRILSSVDLAEILDELQELEMRVVLIVDDLHRLLLEPAFTDGLFEFLRGADKNGSLVALFSSPLGPMDISRIEGAGEVRQSLVNHFQPKALEPFTDIDAMRFLDFVYVPDPPLTADEKRYLFRMGGGSPHFLKIAYEHFLDRNRPSTPDLRENFERELRDKLKPAFQDIWRWCTDEERQVLLEAAKLVRALPQTRALATLLKKGYLVSQAFGPRTFSSIFCDFLREQLRVECTVAVLCRAFPTALCFAQPSLAQPLVCFTLDNSTPDRATVKLACELQGYSERAEETVTLEPGRKQFRRMLHVILRRNKIRELVNADNAQVSYQASVLSKGGEEIITSGNAQVMLLPRDQAVLACADQDSRTLKDYSWLTTAWVTPRCAELEPLRAAARSKVKLVGYQAAAEVVSVQVGALYHALKAHGIRYDSSALTFGTSSREYQQRVRLPAQSIKEHAANCIDGAVLFASLLAASDLDPLILLLPDHAIVGWKDSNGPAPGLHFLDTTALDQPKVLFEDACAKGQAIYEDNRALAAQCGQWLGEAIPDPDHFAILLDVRDVWRTRQVVPFD